ncbi:MAG: efflux transporter outer membrane subunit [Proteobacteria bacterium]|nr:efflux transporter outer membrane subunit [Pseudomonadota bacterium]
MKEVDSRGQHAAAGVANLAILGWVALFGVACAVGPDYRKAELNSPKHWSRLGEGDGAATYVEEAEDLRQWWLKLDDALLSTLIDEALKANLDLRKAQARLREARARRAVAASAYFPNLSASASANRRYSTKNSGNSTGGTVSNTLSAGFDASWEVDVFGGVRRSVEAADADLESSEASLNDTQVSLVAEVARNYFEVRSFQIRVDIARSNLESQTETLQLTQFRAQAGLVSVQDVEQAKSIREQTLAQLPSLESNLAFAEHSLDILLGQLPGSLHARLAAGGQLPKMPSQMAVGIPADTLRQRPDIRVAERKLAAETARVGVATAALYPSLQLSGSIGIEALTQASMGNGFGFFYSLLGGITAPIFYGGRLRAQLEAQDAIREQTLFSYEQTVLSALKEVEDVLVAIVRNRERTEALARAVEAAQNAALLARQRYGAGVIDFQSVVDTERSVLSLEDSLATTRADGILALIRLYKALGGGWTPETAPTQTERDNP